MSRQQDSRLTPWRPDIAHIDLRGVKPAKRYTKGRIYACAHPGACLYTTASTRKPMASQLLFGEGFRVLAHTRRWAWGQMLTDDYVGYARMEDLRPYRQPTHRVAQRASLVFARADIKAPILHVLPMGAQLCVKHQSGAFAALHTGGFIWRADIAALHARLPKGEARKKAVIAHARKHLAAPYLWGGRGAMGIDCSGLIQIVLQAAGLAILRDCDLQEAGFAPARGAPRIGDLAYWPGHVGLLATRQTLLHASGGAMQVVEEPLQPACRHLSSVTGAPVRFMRPAY